MKRGPEEEEEDIIHNDTDYDPDQQSPNDPPWV